MKRRIKEVQNQKGGSNKGRKEMRKGKNQGTKKIEKEKRKKHRRKEGILHNIAEDKMMVIFTAGSIE